MLKTKRKIRIGEVISDKMDKTVVVAVEWQQRHLKYGKPIKRITRFKAHDEKNECKTGDTVRIEESRPLSKDKRWRVREIVKREELAEVKPEEIDQDIVEGQRAEKEVEDELAQSTTESSTQSDEEEKAKQ